jgi:multidrug efflux pump subunit AcrB
MNFAEFSFKKKLIIWVFVIILILGGIFAYLNLSRFEDPEYTIKEAVVTTPYNGATPKEVEEEVTDKIESAIQQLPQIKRVESTSMSGVSEITVFIKDKYVSKDLPQIWDELRRKVNDIQNQLPPGAGPSFVNDDYGDVYGIYYALTGDGFNYHELNEYAKYLRKQLLLVPGVAKISITGKQQEAVFVDISHTRLAQLGIAPETIFQTLRSQNEVVFSGSVRVGDEYIVITPTGSFDSVINIGNLLIRGTKTNKVIRLSDIAKITRGYKEVPSELLYYNGKPGMGVGVSILSGGNMVRVGAAIDRKIDELQKTTPVGIELHSIYQQPSIVKASVDGFLINLLEALAIVIVVLFIFMGMRSGFIIGAILLLTVLGTLLFMYIFGIALQRISLGALVIALGMLVDNAIVIVEGVLVATQKGVKASKAAIDTVGKVTWPLFGATLVGVLAFSGIAMSPDSTGEYTRSLFYVVFISLMLSWILAITAAPIFCTLLMKVKKVTSSAAEQIKIGIFLRIFRGFLAGCIHMRWLTVIVMVCLLAGSLYGFGYVKQSFFPNSTTPMFYVNYWRSEGTDIRATAKDMVSVEKKIKKIDSVVSVTSIVGKGALRFMLVYAPEKPNTSYGQFIVRVKDYNLIPSTEDQVRDILSVQYPNSEPTFKRIKLGPGGGEDLEVRFSGEDPQVLRRLSHEAQNIMRKNSNATDIRSDWRQVVKVIEPVYSETQARNTGISRSDLSNALAMSFTGLDVGLYREADEILPIIARPPDEQRLNITSIKDIQIWSPALNQSIPIEQVVSKFNTAWQDARIRRRNRIPTIKVSCNPKKGLPSALFNQLRPKIEAIKLPPGYKLEWGGEHENSTDAQVGLAKLLPLSFLAMILVVILLFNAIRQPLIIWLSVPLSIIGVTVGLLVTDSPFDFMSLLGVLSLSGMMIKNAIVLIDQIDFEIETGKDRYLSIIDSTISRVRPVSLAAITTVLGMIPLLFDAFFKSMAVTIMFGLSFATVLTLVVIPVLYSIFFNIRKRKHSDETPAPV